MELTPSEFDILQLLMEHPGQAFSRTQIIEQGLGFDYDGLERTVDSHIKNLRRKLEIDPRRPLHDRDRLRRWLPAEPVMKLSQKVYLAFAAVIGIALVTVSILVGRLATDAYRGYVTGYQRQQLRRWQRSGRLYEAGNSWDDVQAWIDQTREHGCHATGHGSG